MPRLNIDSRREDLEEAAVQTLMEVMGNTQYLPEVRLQAAEKALRAVGKAEPPKSSGPQIVFNFGDHLAKSLLGVGKALELMKPAPDAETSVVEPAE